MTDCIGCGKMFEHCIIDALCINCWREKAMKLDHQLAAKETELRAWHEVFGTTQLTHASAAFAAMKEENADLKAAIATPEVYAGIISKVVEMERDRLVEENAKLREGRDEAKAEIQRLVRIILEVPGKDAPDFEQRRREWWHTRHWEIADQYPELARVAAENGENLAAKRCPEWPIKPAAEAGEEEGK